MFYGQWEGQYSSPMDPVWVTYPTIKSLETKAREADSVLRCHLAQQWKLKMKVETDVIINHTVPKTKMLIEK